MEVVLNRQTLFENQPIKYLLALSEINLDIVLRMERDLLISKKGSKERIDSINSMLKGETEVQSTK